MPITINQDFVNNLNIARVTEYVIVSFNVNGRQNATAVGIVKPNLGKRVYKNRKLRF